MTYPIEDESSSLLPSASKIMSSFGSRCPAKLLEVPSNYIIIIVLIKGLPLSPVLVYILILSTVVQYPL